MTPNSDEPTITPGGPPPDFLTPDTLVPAHTAHARQYPETLLPVSGPAPVDSRQVGFEVVPGYEILQELGRGGMGVVYKAKQLGLNRVVALKMILDGNYASDDDRDRFRHEAEAIAHVQHPNIVQVYEVSQYAGQPFFSLEFCANGALADVLSGTPLPPAQAARLVVSLARGIHHAHEHGVIHRDLKPANVLLQKASRQDDQSASKERLPASATAGDLCLVALHHSIPKITDFGLAKRLDAAGRTQDGDVMGTPSYMAPEQAAGKVNQIGPHSDIYSLGAILYELLTGRPPFAASSAMETIFQVMTRDPIAVRALQPKTPRDLETIALKCLQKEPSRRYITAAALADDLERFLDGRPILARPVGPVGHAWRWAQRHPPLAALIVAVVFLLVVGVAGWVVFTRRLSDEKRIATDNALEAETQRGLADQRRELAEQHAQLAERRFLKSLEVADKFFTEVSESTLLHEPGMEELRKNLLGEAREFYEGFVSERRDDPLLGVEIARSLYRLGVIEVELGRYAEGVAQLSDARAKFDRLLLQPTQEGRLEETRAKLLNALGLAERRQDRYEQATAAYVAGLNAWRKLNRDTGGSRAARQGLAECLHGLGNIENKQERRAEALSHYKESLALRRKLVEDDPANESYQRDLAMNWQNLALVYAAVKLDEEAAAARDEALQSFRKLVAAYPSRGRYREDLAIANYNEGNLLLSARRFGAAGDRYGEAAQGFEFLAWTRPGVPRYLNRLGHAVWNRAICLNMEGKPAEAEYMRAREVRRDLAAKQPGVPEYQVAYAQCLRRDGDAAKGEPDKRTAYLAARDVLTNAPPSPEGRLLLAVLLLKLGLLADDRESALLFFDQGRMETRALIRQKQLIDRAANIDKQLAAARERRLGQVGP